VGIVFAASIFTGGAASWQAVKTLNPSVKTASIDKIKRIFTSKFN
jgi:hypothetical protein